MIKAFTLIEVCVVMVISGIVIVTAGLSYSIINKQLNEYSKLSESMLNEIRLDFLISKEMRESRYAEAIDYGIRFVTNHGSFVEYRFSENNVIRITSQIQDTIDVIVLDWDFDKTSSLGLIKEFAIQLKNQEGLYSHYSKEYGADLLMDEIK